MDTIHLFEDGYYLIGNKAVAKSFLFRNETDCERFKLKIDEYLGPLCEILAYGFLKDEFQLVIRLKSRKVFEDYFLKKFESKPERGDFIPESTYIFAQAMANLQSGYAKHFNFKYQRDGGLMKGRYFRHLIESEKELDEQIEMVNAMKVVVNRNKIWTFRRKEVGFLLEKTERSVVRSSALCYGDGGVKSGLSCFMLKSKVFVRGHFDKPPPKRIDFKNPRENIRNLVAFMLMKVQTPS